MTSTTIRERIEQRIFRLRQDDRFDDMLTESLAQSPAVNKLVLTGHVDVGQLREYAMMVIEAAMLREEDAQHELPEARYEVHVDAMMVPVHSPEAETELREAFRAMLRFVHAKLRANRSRDRAWRAFARVAPQVVRVMTDAYASLAPLFWGHSDEER